MSLQTQSSFDGGVVVVKRRWRETRACSIVVALGPPQHHHPSQVRLAEVAAVTAQNAKKTDQPA